MQRNTSSTSEPTTNSSAQIQSKLKENTAPPQSPSLRSLPAPILLERKQLEANNEFLLAPPLLERQDAARNNPILMTPPLLKRSGLTIEVEPKLNRTVNSPRYQSCFHRPICVATPKPGLGQQYQPSGVPIPATLSQKNK